MRSNTVNDLKNARNQIKRVGNNCFKDTINDSLKYEVIVRKLDIYPDAENVFMNLYRYKIEVAWLDSSLVHENLSRFSFIGCTDGPYSYFVEYNCSNKEVKIHYSDEVVIRNESIFEFLSNELKKFDVKTDGLPFNFNCGFVGYFGYELKAECTSNLDYKSEQPDAQFLFLDRAIAFDHKEKKCYLLCLVEAGQEAEAKTWFNFIEEQITTISDIPQFDPLNDACIPEFYLSRSHENYISDINKCLEYIRDGESYEICLTNKINADVSIEPLRYYYYLRRVNPAPYAAYLRFNETSIACSSIERFLLIDQESIVETKPIKGTIRRGKTEEEDKELALLLEFDEKSRSENLMIVDLLRNDLGMVCEVGSIHVPKLMKVETYKTVHQLVSTIQGKLNKDATCIDCVKASFPGGSMTGAPKIRTMEIIGKLEKEARGVYSGIIGYMSLNGSADFNIVIRTAVITPNKFSIGVGGAIVALSNPEDEFDEILLKAQAMLLAFQHSVGITSDKVEYSIKGI